MRLETPYMARTLPAFISAHSISHGRANSAPNFIYVLQVRYKLKVTFIKSLGCDR